MFVRTSSNVKSRRFQLGAAALNRVNMWIPPSQVNERPRMNIAELNAKTIFGL